MTTFLRRLAATFLLGAGFSLPASATSFSTDFTDLWWVESESGWGINLIQQREVIFATLFVYGPDNTPRWYIASGLAGSTTTFTGGLFETRGPTFTAPFTGLTGLTQVGTMTINFTGPNNGTLVYTVNNQQVTKAITRNMFRVNELGGNYLGGMTAIASNCANPTNNGAALILNELTVQHGGGTPQLFVDFTAPLTQQNASCTFTGNYQQHGKFGLIQNGTFSCTGGANNVGTFTMSEIHVSRNGFTSLFTGQDQFCTYNGFFGGTRDVL